MIPNGHFEWDPDEALDLKKYAPVQAFQNLDTDIYICAEDNTYCYAYTYGNPDLLVGDFKTQYIYPVLRVESIDQGRLVHRFTYPGCPRRHSLEGRHYDVGVHSN